MIIHNSNPAGHEERGEGRGGSGGLLRRQWRGAKAARLGVRADEEHPDGGDLVRLAAEALAAPQLRLQREQPVPDRPRRITGMLESSYLACDAELSQLFL